MDLQKIKNKAVDLFYREKLTTALVKEIKGKRLHVLLPTGKEELINYHALLFVPKKEVKTTQNLIQVLKEINENREKKKELFNLEEIWELVKEEFEEISPFELTEFCLSFDVDDDHVAGLLRKIYEEKNYFKIETPEKLRVLSEEEVKSIIHKKQKELERLKKISEGEAYLKGLEGEFTGLSEEKQKFWKEVFKNYIFYEENFKEGKIAKEVLQRLSWDEKKLINKFIEKGIFHEDEYIEFKKLRFPEKFKEKSLEETKRIAETPLSNFSQGREDLTHLFTFTIDSEDTQDFDDALSVEFKGDVTELYVHITDVASYINPGMSLWKEAQERALTLYLPETIYPMLPFELSSGKFSLIKDRLKLAVSFRFVFEGERLIDFKPILSVIKVKKRFTYDEVDRFLIEGEPFWTRLYQFLMKLKKKREEAGAFAIFLPEIQVRVEKNGIITVKKIELTPARLLVAEAMILTNTKVAEYLFNQGVPLIYRIQNPPYEKIENVDKSLYHKILQLRYFSKSEFSLTPGFHSGLGVNFYTTLTSPMRRFLDLFVQYQLITFLKGEKPLGETEVQKILAELPENIQRASFLQSKRHKYFLLKYLKLYLKDQPLKGLVTDVFNKKGKVYLPDFNLTGELTSFKSLPSPGEEIQVKIDRVDPREEILKLKEV